MEWKQLLNPTRPEGTSQVVPDHREQFERDYDRTVFSTPVRRMQDKTQVFPLDPNDSVRTRLTHSMEVSTIAKGLARSVCIKLIQLGKIEAGMDRQIEAIASTCGLLHDLGNPPFGHAGEDAITGWFNEHFTDDSALSAMAADSQYTQDLLLFQGNAQTMRLLTKLQILASPGGLNLTFGTLSAAMKYISASTEVNKGKGRGHHESSKLGYFASENKIVERIREQTGTGENRNPITFMVESADDLAYSVVDLEDGASKGIVKWKHLKQELASKLGEENPIYKEVMDGTYRVLRRKDQNDDVFEDKNYLRAFRTAVIGVAVKNVTEKFIEKHDEILAGGYHKEIVYDSDVGPLIKACKDFAKDYVFCSEPNVRLELMGRHIICDLLSFFWEGSKTYDGQNKGKGFAGKIAALLSDNYKQVFKLARTENPEIPTEYLQMQLVIDYVCGMTDSFAQNLHRELKNG
jgi:dGTPase